MLPPIPNDQKLIEQMHSDPEVIELRKRMLHVMIKYKYSYNWTWFSRPVIQFPSDMMAMQMLVFAIQPDLIIETGIAHGGSLIFYASLFEAMNHGRVLGIDIDIRAHNREAIEAHPLAKRIKMIQGSSIDAAIVEQVHSEAAGAKNVLVILDSNHTHSHVAAELNAYAPLVSVGSYLAVFDTVVEDIAISNPERPWGPGNNPKTAVHEFLDKNKNFEIDRELEARLLFTANPDGYLRRVS